MHDMKREIKLVFQASINYRGLQIYEFKIKTCLVKRTSSNDIAASGHRQNRTHMSTKDSTDEGGFGFPNLKNGCVNNGTISCAPEICMHNSL